jgi:hypothetical protein
MGKMRGEAFLQKAARAATKVRIALVGTLRSQGRGNVFLVPRVQPGNHRKVLWENHVSSPRAVKAQTRSYDLELRSKP